VAVSAIDTQFALLNYQRNRQALWLQAGIVSLLILAFALALTRYLKQLRFFISERLQASHLLRTVIDEMPNIVFMKDASGKFVFANRALANLYGMTAEELVGKTDHDFKHSHEPNKFSIEIENIRQILEQGDTQIEMEEFIDVFNGETHYYQSIKNQW